MEERLTKVIFLLEKAKTIIVDLEREANDLIADIERDVKIARNKIDRPIHILKLSTRAMNCLKARDVKTIAELTDFSRVELLKFKDMGKLTVDEIAEKQAAIG